MGKLTVGLGRFLPLCALLLLLPIMMLFNTAFAQGTTADLSPTAILYNSADLVPGRTVFFDSGVQNSGTQGTGVFNVRWFVDGVSVGYGSHEGVPANSTVLNGNSQFSWVATAGTHTITFAVDVDNHVVESNESNNSRSIPVTISQKPGPQIVDIPIIADPTAFLTNSPTKVRFQARILPQFNINPNSVLLFVVDSSLNPVGGSLCQLLDNGNLSNGDDISGDSVFSCFVTFSEQKPKTTNLAVQASGVGQIISSPSFVLSIVDPLTNEEAATILTTQSAAKQLGEANLAQFGDTLQARQRTAEAIKMLLGVADAGVSIDQFTVWIKYKSGVNGGLMLNPPGTKGDSVPLGVRQSITPNVPEEFVGSSPTQFSRPTEQIGESAAPALFTALAVIEPPSVKNTTVLIWDPYSDQFPTEGVAYRNIFQNSKCPKFTVTHMTTTQATVDSVKTFTQFGTVVISTHGAVDDSQVVFLTRETANIQSIIAHVIDLVLGRISIMSDVFAIRPSFISNLSGSFPNSIVYNSSCQSSANNTMANAFSGKGAKTYHGYTKIVNGDYAEKAGTQLLTNLVINQMTTGDAFNAVTPKVDPKAPNATFTQAGDANVVYSGTFRNGTFETGDLTNWIRKGDGRVIATLGEFNPTEGAFMGVISTGLGFTTDSGSIEQNFCLPQAATKVQFDWNYSSEEFIEWCGAQHPFDDPFEVELVTDTGTTLLFRETVDSLCGSITRTKLAFDQSEPGCTPSTNVGLGTGGNDCTVWSTGWRHATIDIAGIAAANGGKGATLRFKNIDSNDSIFDSAVLLDKIEVVVP